MGYHMYHKFMARALLKYFQLILVEQKTRMDASAAAADALYSKQGKDSFKAKSIRRWAEAFLSTGKLVTHRQGQHTKTFTIIAG
jgi:hypothetical protein